jgi:hypothetical protein
VLPRAAAKVACWCCCPEWGKRQSGDGLSMERARKKCTSQLKVVPEDELTCNVLQIFVTANSDGTPRRTRQCGTRFPTRKTPKLAH